MTLPKSNGQIIPLSKNNLERIPELLGEDEFNDLLLALGIDPEVETNISGPQFAVTIKARADGERRRRGGRDDWYFNLDRQVAS